jgi:hypothetical protein
MSALQVAQRAQRLLQLRHAAASCGSNAGPAAAALQAPLLTNLQPLLAMRGFTSSPSALNPYYNNRGGSGPNYYMPIRPPPNWGIRWARSAVLAAELLQQQLSSCSCTTAGTSCTAGVLTV